MPAHDWTRVSSGIFHHFHNAWVIELTRSLNSGLLPPNYYALTEQVTGKASTDAIALEIVPEERGGAHPAEAARRRSGSGGTATVQPPPKATITEKAENVTYASLRKTIVIRHIEGHEVVALIEILSQANKKSRAELELLLRKAQSALKQNIHILIVDLHPPGRIDPQGFHGAFWSALGQGPFEAPPGKPLLAASYEAGEEITAYLEPFSAGDFLPDMPLFLAAGF